MFGAIGAAAGVYLVFVAVAGIGWGLPLVAEQALSPFVIAASLLAAVSRRRDLGRHPVAALVARRGRGGSNGAAPARGWRAAYTPDCGTTRRLTRGLL